MQISAQTFGEFIDGEKVLTCDDLLRAYDDGFEDVDRNFDVLRLELNSDDNKDKSMSSSWIAVNCAIEGVKVA